MHPLDGPRLKIRRAESEIDRLRLMEDTFFQNTKYYIVPAEMNPISGKKVYRIRINGPPPSLDWGVYIGEIAHNLRSALNYLIYQLALLETSPETVAWDRSLQFPIFGNPSEFRDSGKRMIRLLKPENERGLRG